MKVVKDYLSFVEDYRLNEGILGKSVSSIVNYVKSLISKFKDSAWYYYMIFLKNHNLLPKNKKGNLFFDIYVPGVTKSPFDDQLKENVLNEKTVDLTAMGLPNINSERFKKIIKQTYLNNLDVIRTPQGELEEGEEEETGSVFIWGAPGIGKTSILYQLAKELDVALYVWHLASTDPSDFRGVPKITNVNNYLLDIDKKLKEPKEKDFLKKVGDEGASERTVFRLPVAFPTDNCPNDKGGILFFDEFNQAKAAVLSAALPIMQEHEFQDYKLPSKWIVVAAGNRPEDIGGGGEELGSAMSNRFSHFNYAPNLYKDFFPYAMSLKTTNPNVLGFLTYRPEFFHKLEDDSTGSEDFGWPNPRAWMRASTAEFKGRNRDWKGSISNQLLHNIYESNVGSDATSEYENYVSKINSLGFDKKTIEDIYAGKGLEKGTSPRMRGIDSPEDFRAKTKSKELFPSAADDAYAASCALASYKLGKELTSKEFSNLLNFLDTTNYLKGTSKEDVVSPMLKVLSVFHPEINGYNNQKANPELEKLYKDFIAKSKGKVKEEKL